MARYRFNLRYWEGEDFEEDELKKRIEEAGKELEKSATDLSGDIVPCLVYKTEDLDDAKEVYRRAKHIIQSIFTEDPEPYLGELKITRQPECPKCGFLGRFSDNYCSKCGTELAPKEYIEVD